MCGVVMKHLFHVLRLVPASPLPACVPAMLACWLLNCTHFDRQKHALNGLTLHKKVKDGNVYRNYSEFLISP